jgi:hypothetical protein
MLHAQEYDLDEFAAGCDRIATHLEAEIAADD